MTPIQQFDITIDTLIAKTAHLFGKDFRLVQIGCTKISDDAIEINYSFDQEYEFVNYRLTINPQTDIPSISHIYPNAFIYENEMHDLFGLKIIGLTIDFKGNLYKTAIKTPFNIQTKESQ